MLDWQFDDLPDDPLPPPAPKWWQRDGVWFLLMAALIAAAILAVWRSGTTRMAQSEADLRADIQSLLDLQHNAFLQGDGDLFLSFLSNDPGWRMAQLHPLNQQAARAGFTVTRAQQRDAMVWANLSWNDGGQTWQRIAFFEGANGRYTQIPADPAFFGERQRIRHDWGVLSLPAADAKWADPIAAAIAAEIATLCATGCRDDALPLTVEIRANWRETAVPHLITLPSPRLIALDANSQPAPAFYTLLRQRLADRLTPATVRFAVPPPSYHNNQTTLDYDAAAAAFMAANPHITIDLVHLDARPTDPAALARDFDGAAVPPTVSMIAAGQVRDLSDYAATDPTFTAVDFYEQIWQGAVWQDRIWFMPLAAQMRLLYYDLEAYEQAGFMAPSLRWTWEEMSHDVANLVAAQPADSDLVWGYLDTGLDTLYAYAYNWQNPCTGTVTIRCRQDLSPQHVAAALHWYQQMAGQPGRMPDVTAEIEAFMGAASSSYVTDRLGLGQREQFMLWNMQTTRRQAAIWVDLPVEYERQLLLKRLDVTAFPGSDRFDGVTPLWIDGAFISASSERPFATWQWLKFLSQQRPTPRLIPARPSVAETMGFWQYLPHPLSDAMRAAFPFARPVLLHEKAAITWEQVTAVVANTATPRDAAQMRPPIRWFAPPAP